MVFYKFVKFDPIDADMIINEQAINLTSQHTDNFRNLVTVEDFFEEIKNTSNSIRDDSTRQELFDRRILKRWKTPSLLETLRLDYVL